MQDEIVKKLKVDGVKEAQKDMGNLNKTVETTEKDFKSLNKQLSDGTKELARLQLAGQVGTEAYNKLAQELGNVKDALGDARAAVNAYANDTKNLTDALDVFKTGTSVVGLFNSALVALGADGSKAEEVIKKLAAAEVALNSIQKIQASLMNKSSGTYRLLHKLKLLIIGDTQKEAVATTALATAQNANARATTLASGALKVFRAALISTGIGALVVAVGLLIAHFDDITAAIKRVAEQSKVLQAALSPILLLIKGISAASNAIDDITGKTAEDIKNLTKEEVASAKKRAVAEKNWAEAYRLVGVELDGVQDKIDELRARESKLLKDANEDIRNLTKAIRQYNEELDGKKEELQSTKEALRLAERTRKEREKELEAQRKLGKSYVDLLVPIGNVQKAKDEENRLLEKTKSLDKDIEKIEKRIAEAVEEKTKRETDASKKTGKAAQAAKELLELQTEINEVFAERTKLEKEQTDYEEKRATSLASQLKEQIELNEATEDGYKWTKEGYELYQKYFNAILSELTVGSEAYKKYNQEKLKYDKEYEKKAKEERDKAAKKAAEDRKKAEEDRRKQEEQAEKDRLERLKEDIKIEREAFETEEGYAISKLNNISEFYDKAEEFTRAMAIKEEAIIKEHNMKKELLDRELNEKLLNNKELSEDQIMTLTNIYNTKKLKLDEELNQALINNQESFIEKINRKNDEYQQEIQEGIEVRKEYILAITNEVLNTVSGITDSIFELIDANIQRSIDSIERAINSIDSMLNKVDRNINRHINRLTGYYEALSDATGEEKQDLLAYIKDQEDALNHQYDLEKQLEAEKYQREKQLQKEQAIQQKKQLQNQLIQAIITGAANTLNGFNTQPFMPVGIAMGALAATLSAVQIGVIGANIGRIKYANGGLLSGPSHNDGGIPVGNTGVEVEGGEYVVNKKATAKYLPLLEQINDYGSSIKKFANGGEMNLTTGTDQTAALLSNINFNPVVAVTDINRANSRLDKVKVLSR